MLLKPEDRNAFAANLRDLINAGWHCVVLHGGGPQLNALQVLHGLRPNKVEGRRITSEADLLVVKQALCGQVNVDLVASMLAAGVNAFGCHGASGLLIEAQKRPPMELATKGLIDFGEVGDVTNINTELLRSLLNAGLVPVIASLGVNSQGRVFNINADTTVSAIARNLKANLLILSTMVGGIFADISEPETRISEVSSKSAKRLIEEGIITDGMIPKVQEALSLLDQGVHSIVVANAVSKGTFLDIASGSAEQGTRLVR